MEFSLIKILISIVLILFALYRLWKFIQQIRNKSQSQNWLTITAQVVSKKVGKTTSMRSGNIFFPEIKYRYKVMGQRYENKTRTSRSYSLQKAEEMVNNLGSDIEVRYNPVNPKEHVAEYERINYLEILMIVTILLVALIILIPSLI